MKMTLENNYENIIFRVFEPQKNTVIVFNLAAINHAKPSRDTPFYTHVVFHNEKTKLFPINMGLFVAVCDIAIRKANETLSTAIFFHDVVVDNGIIKAHRDMMISSGDHIVAVPFLNASDKGTRLFSIEYFDEKNIQVAIARLSNWLNETISDYDGLCHYKVDKHYRAVH